MNPGLIDTNVLIHSQTHDEHSAECQRFLQGLERGTLSGWLDPLVLHELSYVLGRWVKGITRDALAEFMLTVLGWPGVEGEKQLMEQSVRAWRADPALGFVDAYLAAKARQMDCVVYTKNVRDFPAGMAPEVLPG